MVGRRDGLITVEVDDESPQMAADIANRLVEELRRLTGALALTEAQQRRVFFEERVKQTRAELQRAQQALQFDWLAQLQVAGRVVYFRDEPQHQPLPRSQSFFPPSEAIPSPPPPSQALLNIISNPVNSTVPIAAETLKRLGAFAGDVWLFGLRAKRCMVGGPTANSYVGLHPPALRLKGVGSLPPAWLQACTTRSVCWA